MLEAVLPMTGSVPRTRSSALAAAPVSQSLGVNLSLRKSTHSYGRGSQDKVPNGRHRFGGSGVNPDLCDPAPLEQHRDGHLEVGAWAEEKFLEVERGVQRRLFSPVMISAQA